MKLNKVLADKIINHLQTVNNIPHINCGGCGYVALALYDLFKKLGLKPKIMLQADNNFPFESNRRNYQSKVKYMEAGDHYLVQVDDYFFDSTGYSKTGGNFNCFPELKVAKQVSKSELAWTLRYGAWNPKFKQSNGRDAHLRIKKYITSFSN